MKETDYDIVPLSINPLMRCVMGKYDPLREYLSGQPGNSCTLTFSEVEGIIGDFLPVSARKHKPWWGNDETHTQASGWLRAGWKVERPRLGKEQVRFTRVDGNHGSLNDRSMDKAPSQVIVRNLDAGVVAELKRRAKRKGRSLERELRMILTQAARPERSKLIAEADRIRAMTAGPLEDSVSLLREDRDSR